MPISGPSSEEIRQTRAYRVALCCGRLCCVSGAVAVVLGLVLRSATVLMAVWFVAVVMSGAMWGLLSWAGALLVPGDKGYRRWTLKPEISQHPWRDMWWLPRR